MVYLQVILSIWCCVCVRQNAMLVF